MHLSVSTFFFTIHRSLHRKSWFYFCRPKAPELGLRKVHLLQIRHQMRQVEEVATDPLISHRRHHCRESQVVSNSRGVALALPDLNCFELLWSPAMFYFQFYWCLRASCSKHMFVDQDVKVFLRLSHIFAILGHQPFNYRTNPTLSSPCRAKDQVKIFQKHVPRSINYTRCNSF